MELGFNFVFLYWVSQFNKKGESMVFGDLAGIALVSLCRYERGAGSGCVRVAEPEQGWMRTYS